MVFVFTLVLSLTWSLGLLSADTQLLRELRAATTQTLVLLSLQSWRRFQKVMPLAFLPLSLQMPSLEYMVVKIQLQFLQWKSHRAFLGIIKWLY